MPRIIRIDKCYNCYYREQLLDANQKAVWLCGKSDRKTVGNVVTEPPLWCPLEHTDGGEDITILKQKCAQYLRKIKGLEQYINDMEAKSNKITKEYDKYMSGHY